MKIVCISNIIKKGDIDRPIDFTVGKIYEVIQNGLYEYLIINNEGHIQAVPKDRFKLAEIKSNKPIWF